MELKFYKYQGTGNDFIMIDNLRSNLQNHLSANQIKFLCDRHFGIGADGLILLTAAENEDFQMIYYNSDGNESSMCGNGGRCVTAFAQKMGINRNAYRFMAIDGLHESFIEGEVVHLKMGKPSGFQFLDTNSMWINTGSPHYVKLYDESVNDLDVNKLGAEIRYSAAYLNQGGTNVNFVNITEKNRLKVRTYERGVEAETLSCGTGVTACAYTYIIWNNSIEEVKIDTPGGELTVKVTHFNQPDEEVWLIGKAEFVFEGTISV